MINLKEQPVGTLKITCPEVTASYFMPVFLGGFARKFPRVSIELLATNRHLDLIRERVDFAFRVGAVSNQDFIVRKLSTIQRVLVACGGQERLPGFLFQSSLGGHGVALLPAYVCQPALTAGRLIRVLPGWDLAPYDMALIFRPIENGEKS
ncbi:LysR substrate-binding domain-containing protein [Mesorhizobium sp. SARCC-RB16n]|uniref:LysR substrate-binding domain-containing protein n=1 Tax=Mesorhizobium sp. SARCC-RB16n TaxID=2116687 RepID=UPI00166939EC|nr:LysR substrate-binding domain-containing protein [Mesorhizobium sp. SARCC-RB16n]